MFSCMVVGLYFFKFMGSAAWVFNVGTILVINIRENFGYNGMVVFVSHNLEISELPEKAGKLLLAIFKYCHKIVTVDSLHNHSHFV